jgi:hypothetical protein
LPALWLRCSKVRMANCDSSFKSIQKRRWMTVPGSSASLSYNFELIRSRCNEHHHVVDAVIEGHNLRMSSPRRDLLCAFARASLFVTAPAATVLRESLSGLSADRVLGAARGPLSAPWGLRGLRVVGTIVGMENLVADYRLSAERCRRRADAAVNEVSKATWLRFAEEWVKLADETEQSAWRDRPRRAGRGPENEILNSTASGPSIPRRSARSRNGAANRAAPSTAMTTL